MRVTVGGGQYRPVHAGTFVPSAILCCMAYEVAYKLSESAKASQVKNATHSTALKTGPLARLTDTRIGPSALSYGPVLAWITTGDSLGRLHSMNRMENGKRAMNSIAVRNASKALLLSLVTAHRT